MSATSIASSDPGASAPRPSLPQGLVASLLSAVAGYVDTAGFIGLFGLFTAHVTGNLVTVGAALAWQQGEGAVARLLMLPVFMLAVAGAVVVAGVLRARGRPILAPLLWLEAAALGLFLLAGVLLGPSIAQARGGGAILIVGAAGVVAMGIQNALMREVLTRSAPTTMMTGNVTQFTIDLTQWLIPEQGADREARCAQARQRLGKTGGILLGFVLGAALGALAMHHLQFWCLVLPAVGVCVLAVACGGRVAERE